MKRLNLLVIELFSRPYVKEIIILLAVVALILAASASDDPGHHILP